MRPESRYLPDPNRRSVLIAVVLLPSALPRLVNASGFTFQVQLPCFYFAFPLSLGNAMTVMAAGLTATGMDWLLRGHSALQRQRTIEYWLLPTLTAFIIGMILDLQPSGTLWWVGFTCGAVLLVCVFLAEYIAC